jgi:hypothetical protein
MIAIVCILMVVTCSWFGFNAIIVLHTHLFELTFEFSHTPIVKDNKLRLRVTCQPSVMKQILDGCCLLIWGQILLFWVGAAHISYAPSLSFEILDKSNINKQ